MQNNIKDILGMEEWPQHRIPLGPKASQMRLPPVGKCIYCGVAASDNVKLSEEHIIPDGLGGDLILPAASCDTCAAKINPMENMLMSRYFGMYRDVNNLKSRKRRKKETKRKSQIKIIPMAVDSAFMAQWSGIDGRTAFDLAPNDPNLTAKDDYHPLLFFETVPFAQPGMLRNSDKSKPDPISITMIVPDGGLGKSFSSFMALKFGTQLACIAKIALGYAVSVLGIDGFLQNISSFILSESHEHASFYIGTAIDQPPTDAMHKLSLFSFLATTQIVTSAIEAMPRVVYFPTFVVEVRLFCQHGGPSYYVVVGTPNH